MPGVGAVDLVLKIVFAASQAATMFVALLVTVRRRTKPAERPLLGTIAEVLGAALPLLALGSFFGFLGKAGILQNVPVAIAGLSVDLFAALLIASPKLTRIALYGLVLSILGINVAWAWALPGTTSVLVTLLMIFIGIRVIRRQLSQGY